MEIKRTIFDRTFPHPICIGGGIDLFCNHSARYFRKGFAMVEVGPVSYKAKDAINSILEQRSSRFKGFVAANLSYFPDSHTEDLIIKDFRNQFSLMYDFVDAITISVTSKIEDYFQDILDSILALRVCYDEYKPILVRISPNFSEATIKEIVAFCRMSGIDGFITNKVSELYELTQGRVPIIASGNFNSPSDIAKALEKGASLVLHEGGRPAFRLVPRALKYLQTV